MPPEQSNGRQRLWIHGRETSSQSYDLGDIVAPLTTVWSAPNAGFPAVGTLKHGTEVTILKSSLNERFRSTDYLVRCGEITGWISELHTASTWSQFVVSGTLYPTQVCRDLRFDTESAGIHLTIAGDQFVATTTGGQDHLSAILIAVRRLLYKLTIAQTFLSDIPLSYQVVNWIEIPVDPLFEGNRIGFQSEQPEDPRSLESKDLLASHAMLSKLMYSPYLELAINDYDQAMRHPQHALIFLARAIESIERFFERFVEQSGPGKEKLMRQELGIRKADVDYVVKRANTDHRRHASKSSRKTELPHDELETCFVLTKAIIQAFVDYQAAGDILKLLH